MALHNKHGNAEVEETERHIASAVQNHARHAEREKMLASAYRRQQKAPALRWPPNWRNGAQCAWLRGRNGNDTQGWRPPPLSIESRYRAVTANTRSAVRCAKCQFGTPFVAKRLPRKAVR